MFKKLLFFFLTLASFSETLTVTNKIIETDKSIFLQSNENIFRTDTRYTHKALVECIPEIEAVFKVVSAKKLEIIPTDPLESGVTYQCQLDTRYVDADIQKIHAFTFTTEKFSLKDLHYFEKEKLLRLVFNDEVVLKTVKKSITLYKVNNLAKTKLQYSVTSSDARVILLKINEAAGSELELHIGKGLTSFSRKHVESEIIRNISKDNTAEVALN
jgi:hypothetical protein